jgi:hypothetical protein
MHVLKKHALIVPLDLVVFGTRQFGVELVFEPHTMQSVQSVRVYLRSQHLEHTGFGTKIEVCSCRSRLFLASAMHSLSLFYKEDYEGANRHTVLHDKGSVLGGNQPTCENYENSDLNHRIWI